MTQLLTALEAIVPLLVSMTEPAAARDVAEPETEAPSTAEPREAAPPAEPREAESPAETVPPRATSPPPQTPTLPEPPTSPEPPTTAAPGPERTWTWTVPPGCPDLDALRSGVGRRLGRSVDPERGSVDGRMVLAPGGGYQLDLQTTTADGHTETHTIDAADCGALTDAAALVVALAIDPVAVAETIAASRADPSPSDTDEPDAIEPVTEPPSTRPPRRAAPPGPHQTWSGAWIRPAVGLGLGAVPRATAVPSLALGWHWPHARLELAGAYWLTRRSETIADTRARVDLGTATLRGCGVVGQGRVEAPLCGGVQLGGMRGQAEGAVASASTTGLWLAIDLGVGLAWWLSRHWALAGGFDTAIPLVHPQYRVGASTQPLFSPATVSGRLWLGAELRFGPGIDGRAPRR